MQNSLENENLMVFDLNSKSDQSAFEILTNQIGGNSPFNRLEFIVECETKIQSIKYFAYFVDNDPKIIMPFYLRPICIQGHQTEYYDVISPYGYSGPIFNQTLEAQYIHGFWNAVDSWYRDNEVISEFIRFNLNNNYKFYSGCVIPTLNTVSGEILDSEIQWANFKKKVRNNIRKAIKNHLRTDIYFHAIDKSVLRDFYSIYITTLDRKKAPKRYYYSYEYFENFVGNLQKQCAIAIVRKEEKPVSAELLILSENTIISHLGGTDADYFEFRPNDFLKYSVLNWGREKGFNYYNLGGGLTKNDSLYHYKKSFFPLEDDSVFYTGRKIINNDIYNSLVDQFISESEESNSLNSAGCEGFFPKYRLEKLDKF